MHDCSAAPPPPQRGRQPHQEEDLTLWRCICRPARENLRGSFEVFAHNMGCRHISGPRINKAAASELPQAAHGLVAWYSRSFSIFFWSLFSSFFWSLLMFCPRIVSPCSPSCP